MSVEKEPLDDADGRLARVFNAIRQMYAHKQNNLAYGTIVARIEVKEGVITGLALSDEVTLKFPGATTATAGKR